MSPSRSNHFDFCVESFFVAEEVTVEDYVDPITAKMGKKIIIKIVVLHVQFVLIITIVNWRYVLSVQSSTSKNSKSTVH